MTRGGGWGGLKKCQNLLELGRLIRAAFVENGSVAACRSKMLSGKERSDGRGPFLGFFKEKDKEKEQKILSAVRSTLKDSVALFRAAAGRGS